MDFDALTLTEILRLQNQLASLLTRRFEKWMAVVFSDIVGSTAYFQRYGDQAGRRIQQQHLDLLAEHLPGSGGKIVNTAGDGALLTFARVEGAVDFSLAFHRALSRAHKSTPIEHRWLTRSCIHWGPILTDGETVAGDTINVCAKLAGTVKGQEILITHQAVSELPKPYRASCRPLTPVPIPGFSEPYMVFQLPWNDIAEIPGVLVIQETGQRIAIPDKPVISCGRLPEQQTGQGNEIVLALADPLLTQRISRWHFELRREADQLFLRAVSDKPTVVDGISLGKGDQTAIGSGATVRLSDVMTVRFESDRIPSAPEDLTLPFQRST